jgi:hypothetical protein
LRRKPAKSIRSFVIGGVVGLALLCADSLPLAHTQDAAATTAEKSTRAEDQPAANAKSKTAAHSRATAKSHSRRSRRSSSRRKTTRGQQKIDPERAQEIQEALVREHYLSPKAEGTWNQASEDAMRRYQADHGWQSKTVPDSRALISLGLGPSHDHLLNPESAMTSDPVPAHETQSAASMHAGPSGSSGSSAATSQPDPTPVSQPGVTDPPHPQ